MTPLYPATYSESPAAFAHRQECHKYDHEAEQTRGPRSQESCIEALILNDRFEKCSGLPERFTFAREVEQIGESKYSHLRLTDKQTGATERWPIGGCWPKAEQWMRDQLENHK